MAEALAIAVGKYTYVHEVGKGPPEAIDAHHIVVRRSRENGFNLCLFTLLLFAYPTFLLFRQVKGLHLHLPCQANLIVFPTSISFHYEILLI